MGLKVGIWEPLWALSMYHIPTWTLWDISLGFDTSEAKVTREAVITNCLAPGCLGFRVLGFRVLGFRVLGFFGVRVLGFRVRVLGFFGVRVLGFRVLGF